MRVVVQRVLEAEVSIGGKETARIGIGYLVFVGIEEADTEADGLWMAGKVARLRLFADAAGSMNLSVGEVDGRILVISQFTLHASTRKGNRPSFLRAARPDHALHLYHHFVAALENDLGHPVLTGEFGAHMQITLTNDGPVTLFIDSRARE